MWEEFAVAVARLLSATLVKKEFPVTDNDATMTLILDFNKKHFKLN